MGISNADDKQEMRYTQMELDSFYKVLCRFIRAKKTTN
jgi:hypothetical protein